jgi:hypothetical protein
VCAFALSAAAAAAAAAVIHRRFSLEWLVVVS